MARPNFVEKTFAGGSKTAKFVKVFSLESFPLYGIKAIACYPAFKHACILGIQPQCIFSHMHILLSATLQCYYLAQVMFSSYGDIHVMPMPLFTVFSACHVFVLWRYKRMQLVTQKCGSPN